MANVSFGGTELSTLGLSVLAIEGRGLAQWQADRASILGRDATADLGGRFDAGGTRISGKISAPTSPWSSFTHANMLNNLDSLKAVLDPDDGYKKLVVTGDSNLLYTNLVPNPSGEINAVGWSIYSNAGPTGWTVTRTTSGRAPGTGSLLVSGGTAAGAGQIGAVSFPPRFLVTGGGALIPRPGTARQVGPRPSPASSPGTTRATYSSPSPAALRDPPAAPGSLEPRL